MEGCLDDEGKQGGTPRTTSSLEEEGEEEGVDSTAELVVWVESEGKEEVPHVCKEEEGHELLVVAVQEVVRLTSEWCL